MRYSEFLKLRSGDLIVWRKKYLRTVQKGPADDLVVPHCPGVARIQFTKRATGSAWYTRRNPLTTYNWHDLHDKIRIPGKRIRTLVLKSEWLTLEMLGFNVRRELRSQVRKAEEYADRTGRPLCKAYPRIKRLEQRATRAGKAG